MSLYSVPYLQLKRPQAISILNITKILSKNQSKEDFLALCELADKIGQLNDSKKRAIFATSVNSEFNKLLPVETLN
jgi:hypothetical protein